MQQGLQKHVLRISCMQNTDLRLDMHDSDFKPHRPCHPNCFNLSLISFSPNHLLLIVGYTVPDLKVSQRSLFTNFLLIISGFFTLHAIYNLLTLSFCSLGLIKVSL